MLQVLLLVKHPFSVGDDVNLFFTQYTPNFFSAMLRWSIQYRLHQKWEVLSSHHIKVFFKQQQNVSPFSHTQTRNNPQHLVDRSYVNVSYHQHVFLCHCPFLVLFFKVLQGSLNIQVGKWLLITSIGLDFKFLHLGHKLHRTRSSSKDVVGYVD